MHKALDFTDPKDNLYAFAKMWSTLDDEPVLSSFHGIMFANIALVAVDANGQERY